MNGSSSLRDRIHFRKTDRANNMGLLHATYVTHTFAPHFHESFALGVIEQGQYTYRYRGCSRYVGRGQIVVINPGEVHTGQAVTDAGWTYRMFYPDRDFIQSLTAETPGDRYGDIYFPDTIIDDPHLASDLRSAHMAAGGSDRLEYEVGMRKALSLLIDRYGAPSPHGRVSVPPIPAAIARVIDYMTEHYRETISLQDLASVGNVSLYHFIRIFEGRTGLSPHAYLMNLRVRAAEALLQRRMSISQAAAAVGFTDQSHMNRWFKRLLGFTPGTYVRGLEV